MIIMKAVPVVLIFLFLYGCVTADQNTQSIYIRGRSHNGGDFIVHHYHEYDRDGVRYRFFFMEPNSSLTSDLLSNFIVDSRESAIAQISANHLFTLIEIENRNIYDIKVDPASLSLPFNGRMIEPLSLYELPRSIYCINWKGNIKNAFNIAVATVTTAYVVAAFIGCAKEGKCEALNHIDEVIQISRSGEKEPGQMFSSPLFTTSLKYSNIIDPRKIEVSGRSMVSGLLMYRRPLFSLNGGKIVNSANCIVD